MNYVKIPQEQYEKAKGQLGLQVSNVLGIFDCYGMGSHIKEVAEEIVSLAEQFAMRVRGKDIPIKARNSRRRLTE